MQAQGWSDLPMAWSRQTPSTVCSLILFSLLASIFGLQTLLSRGFPPVVATAVVWISPSLCYLLFDDGGVWDRRTFLVAAVSCCTPGSLPGLDIFPWVRSVVCTDYATDLRPAGPPRAWDEQIMSLRVPPAVLLYWASSLRRSLDFDPYLADGSLCGCLLSYRSRPHFALCSILKCEASEPTKLRSHFDTPESLLACACGYLLVWLISQLPC